MKLASLYNRTNLFITLTLLIIGAAIYFFAINYIARSQLDNDLSEEVAEVVEYVSLNHKLPKQVDFDEDQTVFIKTDQKSITPRFFDTVYVNAREKENEPGRAIETIIGANGAHYKVIITVSRESTEYLLQFVGLITLGLMLSLLLTQFLANRYFLNGLWKPFYLLLHRIKQFNISDEHDFKLNTERVDEFMELSSAVDSMSKRIHYDYQNLKQLTDNASHEMLTPLAVITSKLDTLIQHEQLPGEIAEQITDIYVATGKLSRMNQTLLLLTKIENNLVSGNEPIALNILIQEKVKQFQEMITARHLNISESLCEKEIIASKYMIDILLNNLFSNAIWHNNDHGKLLITLSRTDLIFENTGSALSLNRDHIFQRFKKGNKSEGTGLGLSLVENICKFYGWKITYNFIGELHQFRMTF